MRRVELMIIDEIHLLGVDRGPVLEVESEISFTTFQYVLT